MTQAPKELYFYDDWLAQHTKGKLLCGNNRYLHENHVDALLKAEREKALREAAVIARKTHDAAMKWAETYVKDFDGKTDSLRIAEEILALISEDATDG